MDWPFLAQDGPLLALLHLPDSIGAYSCHNIEEDEVRFKFWQLGFAHEKDQPTQRHSETYHLFNRAPFNAPRFRMKRKRGTFAVRTLRELAGRNWRGT